MSMIHTKEWSKNISIAKLKQHLHLSKKTKEKLRKANLGKKLSEETKLKIGLASKRNWQNPIYRQKILSVKKGMCGKHHTKEAKRKIGLAGIGRLISEETREKRRLSIIKTWQNPEIREKRLNGLDKVRKQIGISRKKTFGIYKETKKQEKKRKYNYKRKWNKNNPKKIIAQQSAEKKIKIYGNQLCDVCDERKAVHRHHKDYDKPLEVKFVCAKCHSKIHKELRNA